MSISVIFDKESILHPKVDSFTSTDRDSTPKQVEVEVRSSNNIHSNELVQYDEAVEGVQDIQVDHTP